MKTLEVSAKLEELEEVNGFVMSEVESKGSDEELFEIGLAIEELFVNIVNYAYNPNIGKAWVSCDFDVAEKELTLEFRDEGVPFNPLTVEEPDVEADLMNRKLGALGIFLAKNCMDSVDYSYKEDCNVLTLKKHLNMTGGDPVGI